MFDVRQDVFDEHGDWDEARVEEYIDGLMEEFAGSPEAKPVREAAGNVGWAGMMMEYAFSYLGCSPPEMTLANFNEVLFTLFPKKVSTDPESAGAIITELRAFWSFLARQYGLDNARPILATLDDRAVGRLEAELADPGNYGMAKSFFMMGKSAGFDMTTPEGLAAFQNVYNASLQAGQPGSLPGPSGGPFPEPSVLLPPIKLHGDALKKKRKDKRREREAKKRNRSR